MKQELKNKFGNFFKINNVPVMEQFVTFKQKIRSLKRYQKILLLLVAICLPAGILIAGLFVSRLKASSKKD